MFRLVPLKCVIQKKTCIFFFLFSILESQTRRHPGASSSLVICICYGYCASQSFTIIGSACRYDRKKKNVDQYRM